MNIKWLHLLIIFVSLTTKAYGKYKVITSITPIASIISMLLPDDVEISSLGAAGICPHHQQAKISDLSKVKSADINVYIDETFDGFAAKLMPNQPTTVIKISEFKTLKVINHQGRINWHFWLDLDNVMILLKEFSYIFSNQFPEYESIIQANLIKSLQQIEQLATIKDQRLQQLKNIIVVSDSLAYFFLNHEVVATIYEPPSKSLKHATKLANLLAPNGQKKCLILSSEQDANFYLRFNQPIVKLDSENWQLPSTFKSYYYQKYLTMIEQLANICAN